MGRVERVRTSLRRMYTAGRESLRAARERAEDTENGEVGELAGPAGAAAPAPATAGPGPDPAERPSVQAAAEITAEIEEQATGSEAEPAGRSRSVDDAVPRGLKIAAAWSWRLIVIGAVLYALLWVAGRYTLLVAPLMVGLLLAGLLMPAQRGLLRLGVNRSLAALLVVVGGLAVLGGALTFVINEFVAGLDDMVDRVEQGVGQVQDWLRGPPLNMSDADLENMFEQVNTWLQENTEALTTGAVSVVTGTIQFLTGMMLALVVTFFFLRDGRRIWDFLVGMLPERAHEPMAYAGTAAWRSLSGYVRATVLVALVDALGIGVGLWILDRVWDMPLVLPLAALVFLGGFVPIVGAFISGTVAVVIALVSETQASAGLGKALIVLGIVILVQQLESNVLQPFIVSKMVRIHPLAVILAVLAGILLAGVIGALVAVPAVAVVNSAARRLHAYHRRRLVAPS